MKYTLFILGLCLVAVSAGPSEKPTEDVEAKVENILKEVTQLSKDAAANLKNQVEELYLDRSQQVKAAVSDIDDLREINEMCVAAEDKNVDATIDAMHTALAICGAAAVNSSAEIVVEISKPTKQLIFGGYDVLRQYKKCKSLRNPIRQKLCYSTLTVKGTLYLKNARKSTKDIKETVHGIPELKKESDDCSNSAVDNAIKELKEIRASIDACIKDE